MAMSDAGGETRTTDPWQVVAERVAAIIRVSGIEVFRQAVREVACDRLKIEDERQRREEERRQALKKDGVLYSDGANADRPDGEYFFHMETLRGYVKLPAEIVPPPKQPERPSRPACLRDGKPREDWDDVDRKKVDRFHEEKAKQNKRIQAYWPKWHRAILLVFEHVKQRRFPNDDNGDYPYCFQVCCWLPDKLNPAKDPRNEGLLPVPPRALTDAEKKTILAAVYDAHWCGGEKVAPWGLSEDGSAPEVWQVDAERDEKRAALDYFLLFQKAQQLDDSDLPVAVSWLDELDTSPVVLTPEEITILEVLAKENPMTVTQEDLAGQTRLSVKTVRKYVGELREHGLVNQPRGPKKGFAITPAGLKAIGRE